MCNNQTNESLFREHRNIEARTNFHNTLDSIFDEAIKRFVEPKFNISINGNRENRKMGDGWNWSDGSAVPQNTIAPTQRGEMLTLSFEFRHPSDPNDMPTLIENTLT